MVEVTQGPDSGVGENSTVVENAKKSLFQKLKGDELQGVPMSMAQIEELKKMLGEYKGREDEFFVAHGAGEKNVTPEEYYTRCTRSLAVEEAKASTNYAALCDMIDRDIEADEGDPSTYYEKENIEELFDAIFTSHRLPRQRDGKELAKGKALLDGGVDKKFAKFLLDKGYCGLWSPLFEAVSNFFRHYPKKARYQKSRNQLKSKEKIEETNRIHELFLKQSGIDLFPTHGNTPVGEGERVQISFYQGLNDSDVGKYLVNNKVTAEYMYCKGSENDAHIVFKVFGGTYNGKILDIYSDSFHYICDVKQLPKIKINTK